MTYPFDYALHTDLYQLTMAQGYWKLKMHETRAVFDLFFRENPFQGGYTIACGLERVIEMLSNYEFPDTDLQYLSKLKARDDTPLFDPDFLEALKGFKLTVDIDAIPEGTVVFPKEPLIRVEGPIWECQLLETALLNLINFPTLIATKASRICVVAKGDTIIEFGLRRAQGPDGGLTAARAAFVGGAHGTSNVLAGKYYGIPVRGTHAHSWIMAFDTELSSFKGYAKALPNNCLFLVDTYNSIEGVKNAIEVGKSLKNQGRSFIGVRLDSGDLAKLSIETRKLLDDAGFYETQIFASNELDEYRIEELKAKGAKINSWGVGTHLTTAYDQPALGGVYKLTAIQDKNGKWQFKSKTTDDIKKKTLPGIHAVKRFSERGNSGSGLSFIRDVIYNKESKQRLLKKPNESMEDLLLPIFRAGQLVYQKPSLSEIQNRCREQLNCLPPELLELKPKVQYPVLFSLE